MAAAPAGCSGRRRRFAVACGVLSRCVRTEMAAAAHPRPVAVSTSTKLLMPGADITPSDVREQAAEATPPVFDDVPADRVAELVRVAAGLRAVLGGTNGDVPVARKASLQRFMEKRRDRLAARSPYAAAAFPTAAAASEKGKEGEAEDCCCLKLGIPGGSVRWCGRPASRSFCDTTVVD